MNRELEDLLTKYRRETLSQHEHSRLSDLLSDPQARAEVLKSESPEVVFLTRERPLSPQWDTVWNSLQDRLDEPGEQIPQEKHRFRWLAIAASLIVIVLFIFLLNWSDNGRDYNRLVEMEFKLEYSQPAEILPRIQTLTSNDSSITIETATNTIRIKDHSANLENIRQAMAEFDSKPVPLEFDVLIIEPNSEFTSSVKRTGSVPITTEELSKYDIEDRLAVQALGGKQYRQILMDRYEVTCFARWNAELSKAEIINFSIYDHSRRALLARGGESHLSLGDVVIFESDLVGEQGKNLSVAISLKELIDR